MTGHAPANSPIVAECCFLDVGQGTCNVILLGENQAIVVDSGPRPGFLPVRALRHWGVREIVALIVSHNDADHSGGAAQILQCFPKQIHQIYFLEDRPTQKTKLFPLICRELNAGNLLNDPIRLEAHSSSGSVIYESVEKQLSLHILFPWMLANIDAREEGGGNRTSAVLALQCGKRRIVFGGDLLIDGWRQIRDGLNAPIACDVFAVPHHGGAVSRGKQSDEQHRWLYREAVHCETALVSVGTSNRYKHPLPVHMAAIRESGARIICTQITERCCDNLERLRPGVVPPKYPGASSPIRSETTYAGRSRKVACAGSVMVEVGPDLIRIDRLDEHQTSIDNLAAAADGHPLCRACDSDGSGVA